MLNKENKSDDAGQQHRFTSFNLKKIAFITMSSNSNGAQDAVIMIQ